jgi:hypothetical protein
MQIIRNPFLYTILVVNGPQFKIFSLYDKSLAKEKLWLFTLRLFAANIQNASFVQLDI